MIFDKSKSLKPSSVYSFAHLFPSKYGLDGDVFEAAFYSQEPFLSSTFNCFPSTSRGIAVWVRSLLPNYEVLGSVLLCGA